MSLLVPPTAPRIQAWRMVPHGVQVAGGVRAASCPLPRCSKTHSRVEDSPSSHPMGCATPALMCLACSERGKWGVCRCWGAVGMGAPQGASLAVVSNTGLAKTHRCFDWHPMAGHTEQCPWLLGCPRRGAEPHPGLRGVGKDPLQPRRDRQGLTPAVAMPGTTSTQRNRPPPG